MKKNNYGKHKLGIITVMIMVCIIVVCIRVIGGTKDSDNEDDVAAGSEGSVSVNSPVADVSGSVSAMGEGVTYTPEEQEMIAVSIEEADRLASSGDYETALKQIDTAREAYPEASDLRAKQDELNGLYGQQMKANTLERCNTLAEEGDYLTAMHMIEECMQSYGEDNECLAAKEHYITMYKQDILQRSAAYSDAGDYVSAIQLLQSATKEMGNDPELETRSLEYESAYVSGVLAEADSRVSGQDFDGAEKVLKTAKEILPGNSRLDEAVKTVNKSRPRSLLAACPPYQTTVCGMVTGTDTITIAGKEYTNAVLIGENIYDDSRIFFNLDNQYDTVQFQVGHIDGGELRDRELQILYNGELEKKLTLSAGDLPQTITLDVKDVGQLTLIVPTTLGLFGDRSCFGMVNAYAYPETASLSGEL